MELEPVLIHEFGHAFVGSMLGANEIRVWIDEGGHGHCEVDPETYATWGPTERLIFTLGGFLADRRFNRDYTSQTDIDEKNRCLEEGANHGLAWELAQKWIAEGLNSGTIQRLAKQREVELVEQDYLWKINREVSEWLSMDEEQECFGASRGSSKSNAGMAKRGRIGATKSDEHSRAEEPSC